MGLGLAASIFRNFVMPSAGADEIFLPPRAATFAPDAIANWRRRQLFTLRFARVGRQTLFFGAVAGAFYGGEAALALRRGVRDAGNAAASGAATGALLGAVMPGPLRPRTVALYALLGSAAGGASGLASRWADALAPPPPPPPPPMPAAPARAPGADTGPPRWQK